MAAVMMDLGWGPLESVVEVEQIRMMGRIAKRALCDGGILGSVYKAARQGEKKKKVMTLTATIEQKIKGVGVWKQYQDLRKRWKETKVDVKGGGEEEKRWKKEVGDGVRSREVNARKKEIEKSSKLKTYREVRGGDQRKARYVDRWKKHRRRIIAELRCGVLEIEMEMGRRTTPKTARGERKCKRCDTGVVEDEEHFLLDCPAQDQRREKMVLELERRGVSWGGLNRSERVRMIMEADREETMEFICESWKDRKKKGQGDGKSEEERGAGKKQKSRRMSKRNRGERRKRERREKEGEEEDGEDETEERGDTSD